MPQAETIELRSAHGRLLDPAFELSFALRNAGHFNFKRNKRGNITALRLKPRMSLSELTRSGESYVESLSAGRCWALRGVSGNKPAPVIA